MKTKIVGIIEDNRLFPRKLFQSNYIRQVIKFGIVGLSNTVLSYLLYLVFLNVFENRHIFMNCDYIISSILTFWICTVWSFYWNNRITFVRKADEKRSLVKAYIKMVLSYSLTGLFLQNTMLYVLVEYWGLSKEIVPLLILIFTVPLNFLLNKYWAFRSPSHQ